MVTDRDETAQPRQEDRYDKILLPGWRRRVNKSRRPSLWSIETIDPLGRVRCDQPMSHYYGVFFAADVAECHRDYDVALAEGLEMDRRSSARREVCPQCTQGATGDLCAYHAIKVRHA